MPNPVVPLDSQFYQPYRSETFNVMFKYIGPATVNSGPGGAPVTYCASIGPYSIPTLKNQTPYNLLRKNGYKHTPYRSDIDNLDPLPYSVLKWTYYRPVLSVNGLVINHLHSGFGINCPPVFLPGFNLTTESKPSIRYAQVDQALDNQAIADLNSSINDLRSVSVNWAMTYAERKETIQMLGQRTAQLVNTLRFLRKGDYSKAYEQVFGRKPSRRQKQRWGKRSKDRAASLWLEWTYGWSPLVNDVYGAIDDLTKKQAPLIARVTGKAVRFDNSTEHESTAFGGGGFIPTISYPINVERKSSVYYISYYQVNSKLFSSAAGAGLTNPLLLAWELLPFSFVFDWFVNVGDVLEDLTIANGLTHIKTIKSEKKKTVVQCQQPTKISYVKPTSYAIESTGVVTYYEERVEFNRTVSPVRPKIYLGMNYQPLSVRRILSSIALINQLGKGLFAKGRN